MMLEICGIMGIVVVVLIFVIYRHEKSTAATSAVSDVLKESDERDKCTREFWGMFIRALEDYKGLRNINVTVVVLYHKTGKKVSLHFAELLENDWEKKISEHMLCLFERDWSKVWVEISGYSPDNSLNVVADGASSDAFDSVPDDILDGTIDGVFDSTTDGVSKVIPKRTFLEYECLGDLGCNN